MGYYWPESTEKRWVCPRCGGQQQRDLTRLRRGVGGALLLIGIVVLTLMAEGELSAAPWAIASATSLGLLGVLALVGAGRARYCPDCRVRMEGFELPPTAD